MSESSENTPKIIVGRSEKIGALHVVRVLPTRVQRSVGPFVFLDHMAPAPGDQKAPTVDVPPHPHIGLATVTYLFEGDILHRDSLGTTARILPGEVNWMTAGRGVVHSERTPEDRRESPPPLFGVQCWVALPTASEDQEPRFEHYPAESLPVLEGEGSRFRLIAGQHEQLASPVRTDSSLHAGALELSEGATFSVPVPAGEERGVVVLSGELKALGLSVTAGQLLYLAGQEQVLLTAAQNTRAFVVGGPPLAERRYMDWNFVASKKESIAQAKQLYRAHQLGVIEGEEEQLPLPEDVR
jgi:redox-sensitive bicupin YhaK (pirin superfamily)